MLSICIRVILLVPLCLFVFIYLIVNACGKHACRMTCVIFLMLLNVTLIILSFLSGTDTFCVLIAVCSLVSFICNLLALVLPNCCDSLSYYEYEYEYDEAWYDEQPYKDTVFDDIAYSGQEEASQDQFNKPGTSDNNDQNQGDNNDIDNRNSINSDPPAPITNQNIENNNKVNIQENNQMNNLENIPYPTLQ